MHHSAGAQVIAGGAALNHIGGNGERCTRKTNKRGGTEHLDGCCDCLTNRVKCRIGQLRQGAHFIKRAHGILKYRAAAGHNIDIHTRELHGDNDIREENTGIDVVTAHRLHGNLGGKFGCQTGVQHGNSLTRLAVLGQRTPRLAHKPDRTMLRCAPGERLQHRRIGGLSGTQRVRCAQARQLRLGQQIALALRRMRRTGYRAGFGHISQCARFWTCVFTTHCHIPIYFAPRTRHIGLP